MAIFLDEMLTPSASFGVDYSKLDRDCKAMGLRESAFKRFRSLDAGYEIVYEMECAQNELNMHFMKQEFQALREADGDEKSEGFWSKMKTKLKEWWEKFKAALRRVGQAIKNFFIGVYEFIFKHDMWKKKHELLKTKHVRAFLRYKKFKSAQVEEARAKTEEALKRIKELEKAADTAATNEAAAKEKAERLEKELEETKKQLRETTSKLREQEEVTKAKAAEVDKNLSLAESYAAKVKEQEASIEKVRQYAEKLGAKAANAKNAGMAAIARKAATEAYSLIMTQEAAAAATAAAIKAATTFEPMDDSIEDRDESMYDQD